MENGDKQPIEYAEICKTITSRAKEDIRKYNQEIIRETIMVSKNLRILQRTQNLGQDRLNTLIDKHGRETHDQDKIIEQIEEFYIDSKKEYHNPH